MRDSFIFNFIAFQCAWLLIVILGGTPFHWYALIVAFILVILRLFMSRETAKEARLILFCLLLGAIWESILTALSVLRYPHGMIFPFIAPFWIMALWCAFATTLNVSLRWLQGRYVLAAVFGAFGGPLSFLAGERLGAVEFSNTIVAIAVLAMGWAVLMAVIIAFMGYLNHDHNVKPDAK